MAAPPARARAEYDYNIKLLHLGDSGVGKSCLLLRFYDHSFTTSFIPTSGIDFKIRTIEIDGSALNCKFGTRLVRRDLGLSPQIYGTGIQNIEQHASVNVNKVLIGNKADTDTSKRVVPTAKGQALADECGIQFFETSAKTNLNVEQVFFSAAGDIKQRLSATDSKPEDKNRVSFDYRLERDIQRSSCCGS